MIFYKVQISIHLRKLYSNSFCSPWLFKKIILKFFLLSVALAWNRKHFILNKQNNSNKKMSKVHDFIIKSETGKWFIDPVKEDLMFFVSLTHHRQGTINDILHFQTPQQGDLWLWNKFPVYFNCFFLQSLMVYDVSLLLRKFQKKENI